jgi:hypothetical protein
VNAPENIGRQIAWAPLIIAGFGLALFLLGAVRFVLKHRFGFIDALYCCLAVVPAGVLLLVFSYVLQHAKFVSIIPIFASAILIFSFPVMDIALGLAMMGAVAIPALDECKNDQSKNKEGLPKSTTSHGGENEGRE